MNEQTATGQTSNINNKKTCSCTRHKTVSVAITLLIFNVILVLFSPYLSVLESIPVVYDTLSFLWGNSYARALIGGYLFFLPLITVVLLLFIGGFKLIGNCNRHKIIPVALILLGLLILLGPIFSIFGLDLGIWGAIVVLSLHVIIVGAWISDKLSRKRM